MDTRHRTTGSSSPRWRPGVLLVESSSPSMLKPALERAGFRVVAVPEEMSAVDCGVNSTEIDALVLDGDVGRAHALDLISYLRHRFPGAPLIFLGRRDADIVERAALRRGAEVCLSKPVGPASIVAALAGAMAGLAAKADSRAATPAAADEARASASMAAAGATGPHPLWAVVLAGGEGRRLRPLVRHIHGEARPKQYATLTGSRSLLGHTLDRVKSFVPSARTVVVALRRHRRFIDSEIAAGEMPTIVLQPVERGTAPGVLLPVRCILAREPGATLAIFPSDHFVEPAEHFVAHVADAARFVDQHPERVVLIGIAAADAETEYGWIQPGEFLGRAGGSGFWGVERFVEKPSVAAARACLASGGLWNTFVIVARGAALAEAARQLLPAVHERIDSVIPFLGTPGETPALRRAYAGMPHTSLSTALLERCTPVLAVSALQGVRWCDWGAPHRVVQSLDAEGLRPPWLESFRAGRLG